MNAPEARIAALPWESLPAIAPLLTTPIAAILDGAPAERVLDTTLRAQRAFSATDRLLTAEALFGVGLWRRRLRARLTPTAEPRALLDMLVADLGGRKADLPRLSDWRDRTSVPDWLATELERAVGDEAEALATALNVPGPIALRTNLARISSRNLAAALRAQGVETTPGKHAPDALIISTQRPNLFALEPFRQRLFEVQDEGSQLLGALAHAGPGVTILDLCAGAGGKSLQLASAGATVHAVDVDLARLERLRIRAEQAGATIRIHGSKPSMGLYVDCVFVDAPCSELGALRRGPDLRWRMDAKTFSNWPPIQNELLEQAALHVKSGSAIVYATCTFRREENEDVVSAFLERHPDFSQVETLKTFPHRQGTDGFFGARLQRS